MLAVQQVASLKHTGISTLGKSWGIYGSQTTASRMAVDEDSSRADAYQASSSLWQGLSVPGLPELLPMPAASMCTWFGCGCLRLRNLDIKKSAEHIWNKSD